MSESEKVLSILSRGVSLHSAGVNSWALNREQALAAIEECEIEKVAVLGGDVYELSNGSLEQNYDNWYCDRNPGESIGEFIRRSIGIARTYILSYRGVKDVFFVLVVESENNLV